MLQYYVLGDLWARDEFCLYSSGWKSNAGGYLQFVLLEKMNDLWGYSENSISCIFCHSKLVNTRRMQHREI